MIETSERVVPLWLGIVMIAMWSATICFLVYDSFFDGNPDVTSAVAGAPFLLLLGYLLFAAALDKRRVIITPEQVRVTYGPLPGFGGTQMHRSAIAGVVTRYVIETQYKGAALRYYAAGVQTKGGSVCDLLKPYGTESEARAAAGDIARILPVPVLNEPVQRPGRDGNLVRRAIAWSGAFAAALLWLATWEFLG